MRYRKNLNHKSGNRKRKIVVLLLGIILILVAFRLSLPWLVLKYTNNQLSEMKEYTGNIEQIDIRLYRGAYIIKDLQIVKKDEDGNKDTIPFINAPVIDLAVDWNALFKGKIAGKIIFTDPVINYTNEIHEDKEIKKDTADFQELLKSLMPLTINRIEIHSGQIHYIDPDAKPEIDIAMKEIYITAINLTNISDKEKLLPAHVNATASMYGGKFDLDMSLNPLKKNPTFEMQTELKKMDLVYLNDFFKTYGNIEIKKGHFSLFAEFAGKNGNFGGYVKPFIEDFQIQKYRENDDFTQRIWELLVGTAMKILENPKTDKVATKIPVSGAFKDAEIDVWEAIHFILRNAFVQALRPAIENTISVNKLNDEPEKTLLEKVFGGNDKKEERREKREEKRE